MFALCFTRLEAPPGDANHYLQGVSGISTCIVFCTVGGSTGRHGLLAERSGIDMQDGGEEDGGPVFQKILCPVADGPAEGPAEGWQKVLDVQVDQGLL